MSLVLLLDEREIFARHFLSVPHSYYKICLTPGWDVLVLAGCSVTG